MFGTGIEYALRDNWSAKIEYNYLDLGSKTYQINDLPGTFDITQRIHLIKFGVNYRLGWFEKGPVVASY